jgi:hypothetical protein
LLRCASQKPLMLGVMIRLHQKHNKQAVVLSVVCLTIALTLILHRLNGTLDRRKSNQQRSGEIASVEYPEKYYAKINAQQSGSMADRIMAAAEAFVGNGEWGSLNCILPPPGMLKKTWVAQIFTPTGPTLRYLVGEDGYIRRIACDTVREAYYNERIVAHSQDDYVSICLSLLEVRHWGRRDPGVTVLSSVTDIPGYDSHKHGDSFGTDIKKPWIVRDDNSQVVYYNCFLYENWHGALLFCRVGFENGKVVVFERDVIKEGVGYYLCLTAEQATFDLLGTFGELD